MSYLSFSYVDCISLFKKPGQKSGQKPGPKPGQKPGQKPGEKSGQKSGPQNKKIREGHFPKYCLILYTQYNFKCFSYVL